MSAEPEFVDLTLGSGDVGRADFYVRGEGNSCTLTVGVAIARNRAKRWIDNLLVGVWRGEDDPAEGLPLVTKRSGRRNSVRFRDFEPGNYRVVVRHEDYLDGERQVSVICEGDRRGGRTTVPLRSGNRIRFEARDEKGRPVRDALLVAEAIDPPRRAMFLWPGLFMNARSEGVQMRVRSVLCGDSGPMAYLRYVEGRNLRKVLR